MTPITLNDGRTIVPEHVVEVSHQDSFYFYCVNDTQGDGPTGVSESDAALIRTALFEAQRREIAVKILAGMYSNPHITAKAGRSFNEVREAFALADAILAEKGAKG